MTPTHQHVARTADAEALGRIAGRDHAHKAAETCEPGDWTPDAQQQWCAILTQLATNPFHPDQWPYPDATPDQNEHYAHQWDLGFTQGSNAARADLRRKQATR